MLTRDAGNRFEVWGDPIAHSKSPALHVAAYRVLGLDWEYGRRQVDAAGFTGALASLDGNWRGLSLTMPLKEQGFAASASHDRHATLTGAANTLLLGAKPAGFNTDVGGIVDALAEGGIAAAHRVRILGAGATAASALVAVSEIGAARVDIRARRPERAIELMALGERLGLHVTIDSFAGATEPADLTIATLPSGTVLDAPVTESFAATGGVLFDAAYAPWPSALAAGWGGSPVISGFGMLLHQAVRQIRIFLTGDPLTLLPDEDRVIAAMRAAV
ncbi:shikimate dehydrogenase family protein [Microbacterium sp.]|uniref:shikimate dehydrogenase family protein n=1 Tax=Microbacterium sp. TaxID=51671 RepID=UPI003F9AA5AD